MRGGRGNSSNIIMAEVEQTAKEEEKSGNNMFRQIGFKKP